MERAMIRFPKPNPNFIPNRLINMAMMRINPEEWRKLPKELFPDISPIYWVSTWGRIYSEYRNRLLIPQANNDGYMEIGFSSISGKHHFKIHRLVMILFNYIEDYHLYEVNHKDGDKTNNNINNLEWCTRSENIKHAYKIGSQNMNGDRNPNAKLSEKQVISICESLRDGLKYKDICDLIDIEYSRKNVRKIRRILDRESWIHVSEHYIFSNVYNEPILPDNDIHYICKLILNGENNNQIIHSLGITDKLLREQVLRIISQIRNKHAYSKITQYYNF